MITFSKWVVTKEIPIIAIISSKGNYDEHSFLKQTQDEYLKVISTFPEEDIEKSKMIYEFFAEQFSKKETPHDYDYLHSALYTEIIQWLTHNNIKLAGVIYPSVRVDDNVLKGMNVAISPSHADNSLELKQVLECIIYKKGKELLVDNNKFINITDNSKEFTLQDLTSPKERLGRDAALKTLEQFIAAKS